MRLRAFLVAEKALPPRVGARRLAFQRYLDGAHWVGAIMTPRRVSISLDSLAKDVLRQGLERIGA